MGRVANWLGAAGKSATNLGPLDAVFAGFDYMGGKAEGEDDIRAAAGAVGSAAGGWGGAMGGAATGAAIGSIVPGIGTVIGGGIGALVGGGLGSFAGGWGADRIDQAVRGNRGANALERSQESDTSRNVIAGAGAVGAGAYGLNKLSKGKDMYSPQMQAEMLRRGVNPARVNMASGAGQFVDNAAATPGAILRGTPGWAKAAGVLGAGVLANNALGNPVGGAIDAVTGGRTDFRPNTAVDDLIENRMEADRYADSMYDKQIARQREQTGFGNQREYQDYLNQQGIENQERQYKRKFQYDDYMNRMDIGAKQAASLLGSYDDAMQRANQAASTILNARYF